MSQTLTNPTAAEILAYLVQSVINPSTPNEEGAFTDPFRLALTYGKGKKAITYTLMLAVTHGKSWASSWGIEGREISVTYLPKEDVGMDETWEAALASTLSSLANFTKGHEETHKEADPVFDELYELLNKEPEEEAEESASAPAHAPAEELVTCDRCGQGNLTQRGLAAHRKSKHCAQKAAANAATANTPKMESETSSEIITTGTPADVTTLSPEVKPREYVDDQGRRMMRVDCIEISPGLQAVPMLSSVAAALLGSKTADGKAAGVEISAEREAQLASLDEHGILEALKGHRDEHGQFWLDDGRHRFEWANLRGIEYVPVTELTEEQGAALVESTVIGRRHWTKGQRAYLGVILHPEVAGVKAGRPKSKSIPTESELNATTLAERLGVSADVVTQAVKLYTLFYAPNAKPNSPEAIEAADLKAKFEMSIWAGAGLGGVLAGVEGGRVTKDKPKKESGFHNLDKPLGTLTTLSKSWTAWDEDERKKALKLITVRLKDLDGGFRLALSEALAAAEDA